MDVVCTESSGSTEVTRTSDGIVSLAEGCVNGTCVVSCLALTLHHPVLTGRSQRWGGTRLMQVQKEQLLLGSRVHRGSQPVISSSQASSGDCYCCGKRLTRSWKLSCTIFSRTRKGNARCCTAPRTREVHSVIQTTPFIRTPSAVVSRFLKQHTCRPKKSTTFHSRTLVFARPPIPAPFTCCPMPPKSGLMNLFATFFEVTAPLRCTPCTALPSHRDAVSQLRPQFRHCTEPDQDFRKLTCLSVSLPAATATERVLGFDVSHCEL